MRILQIRFKNLNSLTGEWSVDFTHPSYASDGIFAITGPTGAGKTTILDAICLALYGSTPRLGRVTKSTNEIMSRQTGECFAEVAFETLRGRFRCHWSQHRSRRKADGELQAPKHEIAEADSGKVLESKLREVADAIEKLTGMDFDRFTRSMLLAQGCFAAFLQASPDERAPILEQITGTEIYSRISIRVHERRAEERRALETLQAELTGMQLLGEAEAQALRLRLEEERGRETVSLRQLAALRTAIAWLDGVAALEREVAALEGQWAAFLGRKDAFRPEWQRLQRARRALSLDADHAGVVALREQQTRELRDLAAARDLLPVQEEALDKALQALQAAAGRRDEARAAQQREAVVINKIRGLDVQMAEKRRQLDQAVSALAAVEKEQEDCRGRIAENGQALEQSRAQLRQIEAYLEQQAGDGSLVENLTALRRTFEGLHETQVQHRQAGEALAAASREKELAATAAAEREAARDRARDDWARAEQQGSRVAEAIRGRLAGREAGDWRAELDAQKERKRLLEQAGAILERIAETRRELEDLQNRRRSLVAERSQLTGQIQSACARRESQEKELAHLETQVALLGRIRDLEGERRRLEDGQPCPLCGATEHPYAEGNIPAMDQTESALRSAKAELKELDGQTARLQLQHAGIAKDLEQVKREADARQAGLTADEKRCAETFAALDLAGGNEARQETVRNELAGVQLGIDAATRLITDVEGLERERQAARAAMEKAQTVLTESKLALQQAQHRQQTAERDQDRLTRDGAALAARLNEAHRKALAEVAVYGIAELPMAGLDDRLEQLVQRRDRWQQQQARKNAQEKEIAGLQAEREKHLVLLDKLDEELQAKRQTGTDLTREFDTLSQARREQFGEKDPEREEKRLAAAVERAEAALEQARNAHGRREQEIAGVKTRIAALSDATRERGLELAAAEQELTRRLTRAGFADEADYRAARLPEAVQEEIAAKAEALHREQTELETRRADKAASLAAERAKKVTELPGDTLQQEMMRCEAALKKIQQELGAIGQRLADNDALRQRQQERLGHIAAQKRECGRWDLLHDLIGSADGKKFRNFAQGLTFEIMVAHANRQLQQMSDRYLLVRDAGQPLELNVIDNYQAGEIRSTKNLSGGESFIVSLALALGLSHMASRKVRVDSLFLDEGFGTLDEDALETALETLSSLQQQGKLIGVISHVPALKERIGTQVQVVSRTGGRSSLLGPGVSAGG